MPFLKSMLRNIAIGIFALGIGSAAVALVSKQHTLDNRAKSNMAPHAVYLRTKTSIEGGITGDIDLYGKTKDYDNDGRLEGVLYAADREGKIADSALVRFGPDSSITYTRFRVVNGNIEYLLN